MDDLSASEDWLWLDGWLIVAVANPKFDKRVTTLAQNLELRFADDRLSSAFEAPHSLENEPPANVERMVNSTVVTYLIH